MLLKRILAPCPIDERDHAGTPVVELRMPVLLSRAELLTALFVGAPIECDPAELTDAQLITFVTEAVAWDGLLKVFSKPLPDNAAATKFLAACEARVGRYMAALSGVPVEDDAAASPAADACPDPRNPDCRCSACAWAEADEAGNGPYVVAAGPSMAAVAA